MLKSCIVIVLLCPRTMQLAIPLVVLCMHSLVFVRFQLFPILFMIGVRVSNNENRWRFCLSFF